MKRRQIAGHHGDVQAVRAFQGLQLTDRFHQPALSLFVTALDPNHQAGVLRAVKACLIHNTLINSTAIETVVSTPVEEHAV